MIKHVVFLDIDGVLVNAASINRFGSALRFDPEAVAVLREIISRSDAKIVVSSSWRHDPQWESSIRRCFAEAGWADPSIIDRTPDLPSGRGVQIDAWLSANPTGSFIVLDDDDFDLTDAQKTRLIHCSWERGLCKEHIREAAEKWSKW